MLKFSYCIIYAIYLSVACCDSNVPNVFKRPPSREEFDMLISEQGWNYTEKITFDMSQKTVVHHVPAHRNLTESNVMDDFVSKSTVTRFLNQRVCYIRPKSPEEPSLDVLKKSMDMVSSQKYKMKDGMKTIATKWVITGPADVSKLGKGVVDFCRGMQIYDVEEYAKDEANIIKAISRNKRSFPKHKRAALYVLCRPWEDIRYSLTRCHRSQWKLKCKFTFENCFHYVSCTHGRVIDLRFGMCTSVHRYDDFTCCTPACP